jgi:hypothetical protein
MAMRKGFLGFFLTMVLLVVACCMLLAAGCLAQSQHQPRSSPEDPLKRFLQDHGRTPGAPDDETALYFPAFGDLKDDGTQEVIVYLIGNNWCGSGGCTTLILAPKDFSYKLVTKITISRPPIRVLATKSNGWHDIAVQVRGGGIMHAYEAKLSFNGKKYPSNPSVPPARRLVEKVAGEVVIPLTGKGTPIY